VPAGGPQIVAGAPQSKLLTTYAGFRGTVPYDDSLSAVRTVAIGQNCTIADISLSKLHIYGDNSFGSSVVPDIDTCSARYFNIPHNAISSIDDFGNITLTAGASLFCFSTPFFRGSLLSTGLDYVPNITITPGVTGDFNGNKRTIVPADICISYIYNDTIPFLPPQPSTILAGDETLALVGSISDISTITISMNYAKGVKTLWRDFATTIHLSDFLDTGKPRFLPLIQYGDHED